MINKENIECYFIDDAREEKLWEDCIFVFDTSALLQFYYFSRELQNNIFDNILDKIKGRLWIPSYVEYEYLKNRENTATKPIEEKYKKLENENMRDINEGISDIVKKVILLKQLTKKQDTHPYVDNELTNNFIKITEKYQNDFMEFKEKMNEQIKEREVEIKSLTSEEDDIVLKRLGEMFMVGEEYSFQKMLHIVKEGEMRYKSDIPPGYKDAQGSNTKDGIQKFGDLIVWKQIIEHAKNIQKTIVFVTNDVKEDWCYKKKRSNEIRIVRPREELIKEIKDEAGVEFWMYTLSQFIYTYKKLLNSEIRDEVIDEVINTYTINDFTTSDNNPLPEPLNTEEESYILKFLDKDEKIKMILMERNLWLVVDVARKYKDEKISTEDIISIGTMGLVKGVTTYSTDKSINFKEYLYKCIENEILIHLTKNNN